MSDSEKWYMEHMGSMAFWRTIISFVSLGLTSLITFKVFELI